MGIGQGLTNWLRTGMIARCDADGDGDSDADGVDGFTKYVMGWG